METRLDGNKMTTNQTATWVLLVVTLVLFTSAAQAVPGGVELWNTDKVSVDLNADFALSFEQAFRFTEGDLHYEHTDAGLILALGKGVSTSLRYRNVVEFDGGDTDKEHRPHWNVSANLELFGGLSVKNNLRVEYRIHEAKGNDFRYRDRATVSYQWGRLGGYVSDELFAEKGEVVRNRLYLGVEGTVLEGLKIGAFYLRRTQEKDHWAATHMVGVNLAVSVDLQSHPTPEMKRIPTTSSLEAMGQSETPEAPSGAEPNPARAPSPPAPVVGQDQGPQAHRQTEVTEAR